MAKHHYIIVEGSTIKTLSESVNEKLEENYELAGGMAIVVSTPPYPAFYQAMIKKVKHKKELVMTSDSSED